MGPIRMQAAPHCKHDPIDNSQGCQEGGRPGKNGDQARPFARGQAHDIPEGSNPVDGQRQQNRYQHLEKRIAPSSQPQLVGPLSQQETSGRLQQEPVGQDDGGREFIAHEDHEQFPDDHHLGDGKGESHEDEGQNKRNIHESLLREGNVLFLRPRPEL